MSNTHDVVSCRYLLDQLRPAATFVQGMVLSTLPRGGLQVAQPLNVSESVLKAYSEGLHAQDVLSWKAILGNAPVLSSDVDAAASETYVEKVLAPLGAKFALALPLAGPVLEGYPGTVHLFRTQDQGNFTADEIAAFEKAIQGFEMDLAAARQSKEPDESEPSAALARPPVSLAVLGADLKALTPSDTWTGVDDGLRNQMIDHARQQFQSLNGHEVSLDRINLPDSHGDQWVFNRVVYKSYPALGEGAFTFFLLQPKCEDWSAVKAVDLQADPELSRLMPAVRFMCSEYGRGPTLVEISQQVKLSPFHFHRRFTELLGMTPKQYMLACQIRQAKTDLLAGKDLAEIAKECGFAHQSHFTSRFKQATGLTPTRWRRMAQRRGQAANN